MDLPIQRILSRQTQPTVFFLLRAAETGSLIDTDVWMSSTISSFKRKQK